jgi:glucosamine-6-phosphate deaminase
MRRENVHMLDGTCGKDAWAATCAAFEEKIAAHGGLDLVFCSTGGDGHVARNEPGSSLKSRTRPKTLAHDTKVQLAARWGVAVDAVPGVALTMGIGTIMDAKRVLVLFASVHRAYALERCLEHGINHMYPVSMLQQHPEVTFACDEDATFELRVKTVKYFKSLEAAQFLR